MRCAVRDGHGCASRAPADNGVRRARPSLACLTAALIRPAARSARRIRCRAQPTPTAFKEAPAADAIWLPAAPADALDRGDWWTLFGDPELDRLAAQVDGLEPERRRRGRRLRAGAGAGARTARRAVPDARPRRHVHAASGGRGSATVRHRAADQPRRELGAGPVGTPAQQRRGGERRRRSERGRSRGGAPVGAGRAGDQLLLAARGRCRDRAAALDGRGLSSARCRSRRTAMRPA